MAVFARGALHRRNRRAGLFVVLFVTAATVQLGWMLFLAWLISLAVT